jgi:hypothetical protein
MSDENDVQAGAPAEDGFINLDVEEVVAKPEIEEKPEDDQEKPETTEEEPDKDDKEDDEDKPRKRSGIQRLKARADHLASELAARERQLEEVQRRVSSEPAEKEPVEADFPDFFAYQRALNAYDTRRVLREERQKDTTSNIQNERNALQRERVEAHKDRVEAAKEFIKDYDAVIQASSSIAIKPEVAEEILSSDKSELVAYHLAQNPDKLRALNSMTPRELAKEIGRLEASVKAPSAKTQTSAPPPASRVKGGASPVSQDSILDSWLSKTYPK